ncbi:AbrB/MazE/SpoVT family DNA-binding domain-containing protein [Sphingobacterium paludis]|uniref:Transcriptional regulator/antitoxin MazE n=1 Tax=Sphingobacterium paludis TaxID=1476465 RepID=A0A4R7CSV8_9SPHI|nr:hypothetical protein [Sphingobacterium paludis]TDS10352.1 transcriptional regulator/antitoxin MazE [Sphingobacterium paludis]
METKIRKIGNSLGVVLSRSVLMATELKESDRVVISSQQGKIVIEKARLPREGWAEMIMQAKEEEERFFPEELENKFDQEEWTWE